MMEIRILLADDHKLFRDGLRTLLEKQAGVSVVGEAGDGLQCVQSCRDLKPDVILMDISMPQLNGIEATRRILQEMPKTRVIMLSMHSDRRFVIETLKTGAMGYLLKDSAFEELVSVLGAVMDGRIYLSREITDIVVKDYVELAQSSDGDSTVFSVLSAREREVLQLLAEGRTTKEIADKLHVSGKTIETHRKQIMQKLDLHSIAELTKYAIREGLTQLE